MSVPVAASYSGGTSSEWQIEAALRGVIPRPEHFAVFFAETLDEHWWTYARVKQVEQRCKDAGVPFFRCYHRRGGLGDQIRAAVYSNKPRLDNPPFYIKKAGGVRGQAMQKCSREFKRDVLRRYKRAWLRSLRLPKTCHVGRWYLTSWIGFAWDEPDRVQTAEQDVLWERLDFPAFRMRVTRDQQREQLIEWTGSAPDFSCCVFCPHKDLARWKRTTGRDLERAIQIDEAARNLDEQGLTQGEAFVSDKLIPLRDLMARIGEMKDEPRGKACGTGRCFL